MQKYYIILDLKKVLDLLTQTYFAEQSLNGYWGPHIAPWLFNFTETGLKSEDPRTVDITFHQNGNYYPPEGPKVSEFSVEDLFDMSELDGSFETIHEVRMDALRDWAETKGMDWEEAEENVLDEDWKYYDEVHEVMDNWENELVSEFKATAALVKLNEIKDGEIIYQITWR